MNANFKGAWSVVALEDRESGKWKRKADFRPDEWTIGFWENGGWSENFRPEEKSRYGRWVFDPRTDIFLTAGDTDLDNLLCNVFEAEDENEGWLYVCEEGGDIHSDRNQIISHSAHRRLRIARS